MKLSSILFILVVLFAVSCGDSGSPVLNITSPENGAEFSPGDAVSIRGTITDDVGLATFRLRILEFNIDEEESFSDFPLSQEINITLDLDPNTQPGEYEVEASTFDIDGNSDEENFTITVL